MEWANKGYYLLLNNKRKSEEDRLYESVNNYTKYKLVDMLIEKYKDRYKFTVFNQPFTNENEALVALEEFDALTLDPESPNYLLRKLVTVTLK